MEDVQEEFLQFYGNILGSSDPVQDIDMEIINRGPVLTEQQGQALCAPILDSEIKEAFFSIPADKAPGPDGLTSAFFKATLHIVGKDICWAIKDFFRSGKLLQMVNATFLTLVPKVSCPRTVGDYRPIACCNMIYKVITKIITSRLQLVMDYLVDEVQGAFVKNRSIVDNISRLPGSCSWI